MTFGPKAVRGRNLITNSPNLLIPELDDRIALGAMHVVMGRVAEVMLVNGPVGDPEFPKQTAVHKKTQGSVDRRTTDVRVRAVQVRDKLVSVEVLVGTENMTHQNASRSRQFLAADLEEFTKLLLGRLWRSRLGKVFVRRLLGLVRFAGRRFQSSLP